MALYRPQLAVACGTSSEVRKRLRLGAVVRAVVVQPLAQDTAVVNVRGVNTIAVSPLPLVRGQVLYAEVVDIGDQVHLRLLPASLTGEASHTTTAAELARHLAEIGIEPTEPAIDLAAAMLAAEMPITPTSFAAVARLVEEADHDDAATAAAAAWVVRHERAGHPRAVEAVRAALFERPCLGELLEALGAALATAGVSGHDTLAQAVQDLVERIRMGRPLDWLRIAVELGEELSGSDDPARPGWLALLAPAAVDPHEAIAKTAGRLLAVITGIGLVSGAAATPGEVRRPLHVPFAAGHAIRTAFVDIVAPTGELEPRCLATRCTVSAWVPLGEAAVVSCEVHVRNRRACVRLVLAGSPTAETVLPSAVEALRTILDQMGVELADLETTAADVHEPPPSRDQTTPAVGLDFTI